MELIIKTYHTVYLMTIKFATAIKDSFADQRIC